MDAAGARALARRIEEEQARAVEHGPRPVPTQGSLSLGPAETPHPEPASAGEGVTSAREAAPGPEGPCDIRRYTTDVRRDDVGGGASLVTTIWCHSFAEGRWQSRIVDVRVEPV